MLVDEESDDVSYLCLLLVLVVGVMSTVARRAAVVVAPVRVPGSR